jgi:hypothetical protein
MLSDISPSKTFAFTGGGVYPFPFPLQKADDLVVKYVGADGLVYTVDTGSYTVSTLYPENGGSINFTDAGYASSGQLLLQRVLLLEQGTDWVNNDDFSMSLLEKTQDRMVMMIQQVDTITSMASSWGAWRGEWVDGAIFKERDITVAPDGDWYACLVGHTATDFTADLALGYWVKALPVGEINDIYDAVVLMSSQVSTDKDTATTQAGIATTKAGIATTQAGIATTQAGIATTQANTATTQANTATTQAGIATVKAALADTKATFASNQADIATTQAGIATTQAGIATTQAGIATTKAGEADASATAAAASASMALNAVSLPNFAALTTETLLEGKRYSTLGRDVGGDGGHGTYLIVPGDVSVLHMSPLANEGTHTAVLQDRPVNVLQAGIKRDGVTESATIHNAIRSLFDTIIVPAGTYLYNGVQYVVGSESRIHRSGYTGAALNLFDIARDNPYAVWVETPDVTPLDNASSRKGYVCNIYAKGASHATGMRVNLYDYSTDGNMCTGHYCRTISAPGSNSRSNYHAEHRHANGTSIGFNVETQSYSTTGTIYGFQAHASWHADTHPITGLPQVQHPLMYGFYLRGQTENNWLYGFYAEDDAVNPDTGRVIQIDSDAEYAIRITGAYSNDIAIKINAGQRISLSGVNASTVKYDSETKRLLFEGGGAFSERVSFGLSSSPDIQVDGRLVDAPFPTLTDLTAATLIEGKRYSTLGKDAEGDGGHGDYLCIAGDFSDSHVNKLVNGGTHTAVIQNFNSIKQAGARVDGVTNDTLAINAAVDYAAANGIGRLDLTSGTILCNAINLIDKKVVLVGRGMDNTRLVWDGATPGDFILLQSSQTAATKLVGAGITDCEIDCNSVATIGIWIRSVNFCAINNIRIKNPTVWGMFFDCLDNSFIDGDGGPAGNNHNDIRNIRVDLYSTGGGIYAGSNGGQLATVGANTSLNLFENIYINIRGAGDGFVFGGSDNNTLMFLRTYRPPGATGRGLVFEADDGGKNDFARENQCYMVQTSDAGVFALAGDGTQPSDDNFVLFSFGNTGIVNQPVVEAGASLGVLSQRMMRGIGGKGMIFASASKGEADAASDIKQGLLDITTESQRIVNGSAKAVTITNGTAEWQWGLDTATGQLRFNRVAGVGYLRNQAPPTDIGAAVLKTETRTSNKTLIDSDSVLLLDATAGNRTFTIPLANSYGTSRTGMITLRRIDVSGNTVSIVPQGADTINGSGSVSLAPGAGATLLSNGVDAWYSDSGASGTYVTYDNITALKAATLVEGRIYSTKGYNTPGDGGHGDYLIVAGDSSDGYVNHLVNGGTATAVLQWQGELNAKQGGASGDGVTDDRLPLQAVFDISDNIYIPDGIYRSSGKISKEGHMWSIRGAGSGVTTLLFDVTTTDNLYFTNPAESMTRIHLKGISVTTTAGNKTAGASINFDGNIINADIDDIYIRHFWDAFYLNGVTTSYFDRIAYDQYGRTDGTRGRYGFNCQVTYNRMVDWHLKRVQGSGFRTGGLSCIDAHFFIVGADGIYLDDSHFFYADRAIMLTPSGAGHGVTLSSILVSNCYFDTTKTNHIYFTGTAPTAYKSIQFSNCLFRNSEEGNSVQFSQTGTVSNVKFTGCIFRGNYGSAIKDTVSGNTSHGLTVTGCTFDDNNKGNATISGDIVMRGTGAVISGNSFTGGGANGHAIRLLSSADNAVVTGNNAFYSLATSKIVDGGVGNSLTGNLE